MQNCVGRGTLELAINLHIKCLIYLHLIGITLFQLTWKLRDPRRTRNSNSVLVYNLVAALLGLPSIVDSSM
jgi:uncharacterized protein YhhL (DUF1145 family)